MKFKEMTINNTIHTIEVFDGELPFFSNVEDMFDALKENIETGCPDIEKVLLCDVKNGLFVSEIIDEDCHIINVTIVSKED